MNEDDWEDGYLPADEDANKELKVPCPLVVLYFPLITRRIAAQRSRFIVFGTDPAWLSEEFKKANSTIKAITSAGGSRPKLRLELRDCGVSESVIYPDFDGFGARDEADLARPQVGSGEKIACTTTKTQLTGKRPVLDQLRGQGGKHGGLAMTPDIIRKLRDELNRGFRRKFKLSIYWLELGNSLSETSSRSNTGN